VHCVKSVVTMWINTSISIPRNKLRHVDKYILNSLGARWSSGQCARRAITEAKHRSQWPVIGCVTKIYYLELLRASEGTLRRWSRLHLQSLAPTQFQGGLTSGRRTVVKIIAESLSQHDAKYVVPTPLGG
jgi:hypothetical protein